jgi:hypothetical protein
MLGAFTDSVNPDRPAMTDLAAIAAIESQAFGGRPNRALN